MEVRKSWLKVAALCLVAGIGILAGSSPTPALRQTRAQEREHRRFRSRPFDRLEEARIRAELGIPSGAEKVLILSQTAHMDWDWQNWFVTNVDNVNPPDQSTYWSNCTQWADAILTNGSQFLSSTVDYYYSNAEIGFVRASQKVMPASSPT